MRKPQTQSPAEAAARFMQWRKNKRAQKKRDGEIILDVCDFIEQQDVDRTIIGGNSVL